jgi:hypothetical protein
LLRSDQYNQMQIRSDEELSEAHRQRLTEAGWTERPNEGIWTKQLPSRKRVEGEEPKLAWPIVVEAERFFQDLGNAMRADKRLAPIGQETGQ